MSRWVHSMLNIWCWWEVTSSLLKSLKDGTPDSQEAVLGKGLFFCSLIHLFIVAKYVWRIAHIPVERGISTYGCTISAPAFAKVLALLFPAIPKWLGIHYITKLYTIQRRFRSIGQNHLIISDLEETIVEIVDIESTINIIIYV